MLARGRVDRGLPGPAMLAVAIAILAGSACGTEHDSAISSAQRYDSAGIEVVRHAGLPDAVTELSPIGAPLMHLGSVEGGGEDTFARVADVDWQSDSSVIVLDGTLEEIMAFSVQGEHKWTAGGPGEGPGEFGTFLHSIVVLPGDSVAAHELGRRKVTVFTPDGEYARSFYLERLDGYRDVPHLKGGLSDGGFVGLEALVNEETRARRELGRGLQESAIVLYGPEGELRAMTDPIVGRETWGRAGTVNPDRLQTIRLRLGREAVVDATNGTIAVTERNPFEVRLLDERGRTSRIIGVDVPVEEIDAGIRRTALDNGYGIAESMPQIGRVIAGAEGSIWVQEFDPSSELSQYDTPDNSVWWVFDEAGDIQSRATLPREFRPFEVRGDLVLGLVHDDLNVPYVQVLRVGPG